MKAVILIAGVGSRLGKNFPKCLTKLSNGETILQRQLGFLQPHVKEVIGVVGYKKEFIMELYPEILYVYNPIYITTNTSKSLLAGLRAIEPDDVLWINGDVVCTENALKQIIEAEGNVVAVDYTTCGEEEVKFTLDAQNNIKEISKQVTKALGEAVGINKISRADFVIFTEMLEACADDDYFEKAIELCIEQGVQFKPVDVGNGTCIEVDFAEDLGRAEDLIIR